MSAFISLYIAFCSPFVFANPRTTSWADFGFTFQAPRSPGAPFCYFVDDLYSVSDVQYDSYGATAVISLKSAFYASAFPSTPVNPLRLSVTYHRNDMLQFKVHVYNLCIKYWSGAVTLGWSGLQNLKMSLLVQVNCASLYGWWWHLLGWEHWKGLS